MPHHLDWLLNMLILLRYYSLDLRPLLVLLSLVLTWLLFGYGWFLESLRQLRHIAVIISHGAPQTSYHFMEGEFHVPFPLLDINLLVLVILFISLLLKFISPFSEPIFMTIIIVCCTLCLETIHQPLHTWTGKFFFCFFYHIPLNKMS